MSAPRRKSDRLSWFKQDAGRFVADTAGLSLRHSGAYAQLMNLYWLLGNSLPNDRALIMRKVFAFTPEDVEAVVEVLEEFFPLDADGQHSHGWLDDYLAEVEGVSVVKKAAAAKRWEGERTTAPAKTAPAVPPEDSADF
ncbi:MAG TPA: DUF1376 domain-containing protein [Gallionella sp.]|nr:DUF1376 domain-containing protein [Gallionella sp.]